MKTDSTEVTVRVKWKLEKFEGEKREGDLPVEVIEGEDEMPLAQFKEMQNGTDISGS